MNIANQVKIERMKDHFVLRFSMRHASEAGAEEEHVATIAVPLTTAIELSLGMFEAMTHSIVELQMHFVGLQSRINEINKVAGQVQTRGQGTPTGSP